jgi:phosphoglycerate dehydrogenase-like enzyme
MRTLLLCLDEDQVSDENRESLTSLIPNARLVISRNKKTIAEVLPKVEIAAGWVTREKIGTAPRLRWMHQWWAGADWVLKQPEAKRKDLLVTTSSGIHAIQITEHIFSFLLAFARGLPAARDVQVGGTWHRPDNPVTFELYDKTLLVVGVGEIGSRTAEIGRALGMRVIGVRRNRETHVRAVEKMYAPNQLNEALPQADFVAVVTPLTNETRGMIGPREFEMMKNSSFIINVGRGAVINEAALVDALQKGLIAGAGLDTFEVEPLPDSSPLWAMDNVIITCHYAGDSPRYNERAMELFLDNLSRYAAGTPLRNVVDTELGY